MPFFSVVEIRLFVTVNSVELRVVIVRLGVHLVILFENFLFFLDVHHVVFFDLHLRLSTAISVIPLT